MDKDIKPIGVYDRDLDLFENQYPVPQGISYNSYLITDEKIALIDTTDARTETLWRQNLLAALPAGRVPDYLVVQHLEPDHASQIEWVMAQFPQCRLVCTATAKRMLPQLADVAPFEERILTVGDGDTLPLGARRLEFVTAPMVHWPEVMMAFEPTTGTLFSADAFGRFGNPDAAEPWDDNARRYYFNIVGKYGLPVQALFKKLAGKQIAVIAPLHGPVLEGDLGRYLNLYTTWATYGVETPGVLVAYASIHGMTERAALVLADMLRRGGAPRVVTIDLCRADVAAAVEEAFRMDRLVCMAATYDAHLFPPMHDFIHHLALKGYCCRRVGLVENGLWAPVAAKVMRQMFEQMKDITIAEPIVTLRGRLTPQTEEQLRAIAHNLLTINH